MIRKDACGLQHINYNVERVNLYESIAKNLEDMILNDASQVGQKLPSEQTLATNFGVSRNVIRESLKLLKERQLIRLHVGEGAYIQKPGDQSVTDMLNRIVLMESIDPIKIYELRTILEVNACRMAAENKEIDDNFAKLEAINQSMRQSMDDTEKRVELDLEFHNMVAHLSGNPLLELFERSLAKLAVPVIRTALLPTAGNEAGICDHQRIIEALQKRDADEAVRLMNEHLRKSTQNYLDGNLIQTR